MCIHQSWSPRAERLRGSQWRHCEWCWQGIESQRIRSLGFDSLARNGQISSLTLTGICSLVEYSIYKSLRKLMTKSACRPCGAPLVAPPRSPWPSPRVGWRDNQGWANAQGVKWHPVVIFGILQHVYVVFDCIFSFLRKFYEFLKNLEKSFFTVGYPFVYTCSIIFTPFFLKIFMYLFLK